MGDTIIIALLVRYYNYIIKLIDTVIEIIIT